MTEPLIAARCEACDHVVFPQLPVCPRCAGRRWRAQRCEQGVIEHVTSVDGGEDEITIGLAAIRLDAGPVLTARCGPEAAPGNRVRLLLERVSETASRVIAE
jgi:uncharacterized OB-fold protein